jgi:hypothetical protein
LLFDSADAPLPSRVIDLRSAYQPDLPLLAHTFVPGVAAGQVYAYRISGAREGLDMARDFFDL